MFLADETVQKAAIYDLMCISEATARLLDLDPHVAERHPKIPWKAIRSIANTLRHAYGRVDLSIVWDTVAAGDLTSLMEAVAKELTAAT